MNMPENPKSYVFYAIVFAWGIALSAAIISSGNKAQVVGDGNEYVLQAVAFARHFSPEIEKEDIASLPEAFVSSRRNLPNGATKLGLTQPLKGNATYSFGFVATENQNVYGWHFWLYSALVSPIFKAIGYVDGSPALSFVLFNWIMVLLALSYTAFVWQRPLFDKHLVAILFLLGGTSYYVWWTHPEVFTSSLLLISLMALSDKRTLTSILASALAATQNPPLVFLVAAIVIVAAVQRHRPFIGVGPFLISVIRDYRLLAMAALGLVIVLWPLAFFFWKVGVPNPIAATGWADASLLSLHRMQSLFFDLNQGMVMGIPGVFFGGVVVLFVSVFARARYSNTVQYFDIARPIFLAICCSVVLALPTLATLNWNHGQTVFNRYAYWLAVPIMFGFVWSLGCLNRGLRIAIGTGVAVMQAVVLIYYGVWGQDWKADFLVLKPFATAILDSSPSSYNPVPEIFIERVGRKEERASVSKDQVYVYCDSVSHLPRKLLVNLEAAKDVSRQCDDALVVPVEGGWAYLNLPGDKHCNAIDDLLIGAIGYRCRK